jgi:hypothetical protein
MQIDEVNEGTINNLINKWNLNYLNLDELHFDQDDSLEFDPPQIMCDNLVFSFMHSPSQNAQSRDKGKIDGSTNSSNSGMNHLQL